MVLYRRSHGEITRFSCALALQRLLFPLHHVFRELRHGLRPLLHRLWFNNPKTWLQTLLPRSTGILLLQRTTRMSATRLFCCISWLTNGTFVSIMLIDETLHNSYALAHNVPTLAGRFINRFPRVIPIHNIRELTFCRAACERWQQI